MDDLLIIGGGPVGLAASIYGRMAGLSVRVLEARSGVIDKACGEGLMPGGVKALAEMGVTINTNPGADQCAVLTGIRYVDNGCAANGSFRHGNGLGIRRLILHQALRQRALELGVIIEEHRAEQLQKNQSHVQVDQFSARYLIAADGLKSFVRRQLALNDHHKHYARYGLRRHFKVTPWTDGCVEIHLSPFAEAYVTPISSTEVGVAILFGDRLRQKIKGSGNQLYDAALQEFPALTPKLKDPSSKIRGSGPFKLRIDKHVEGHVLLVGDAAGYVDPLTGEGLRLGFATAKAAVNAVELESPLSYEKQWQSLTLRYRLSTEAILLIRRSRCLSRLVVPVLSRFPGLFDWSLGQMEK